MGGVSGEGMEVGTVAAPVSAETYEQQTGKDVMPETKNGVKDNEASLGALIGAALADN